jgi:NitT/TauT family transport system ATP-binding protein
MGEVEAIHDVSLEVAAGEFVAVVGPSGCGKSSLLNLIAGLDRPTAGEVLVDGEPVLGPSSSRIMVFQEHALYPWLNVQGNVEFGMKIAGVPRAGRAARARDYLRKVQLESFARARVHELSGGMKQRASLARALVLRPRVLLMDEPFAALDAQTRDSLLGTVQDVWETDRPTVLFVTHNVREAACLGERVVIMSPRPSHIEETIALSSPHPRAIEDDEVIQVARRVKEVMNRLVVSDAPLEGVHA